MKRSRWMPDGLFLPRTLMLACACLAATSSLSCVANEVKDATAAPVRPDLSRASLAVGARELRPIRIANRWPVECRIGELLIRIQEAKIECVEIATGKTRWHSQSEAGPNTLCLGEHKGVLFVAASNELSDREIKRPLVVHRLRLRDAVWLKPLSVPLTEAELKAISRVTTVFGDAGGLLVLCTTEKDHFPDDQQISYRVTCFREETAAVIWSTVYPSGGSVPPPQAILLGSRGPARTRDAIRGFSKLGTSILICGGPLEDLIAINPLDGKVVWRVPRVWEFRRGFIGPSVWSYFLGRYGFEEHDVELAALTLEQLRVRNKAGTNGRFAESYFQEVKAAVNVARTRIENQPSSIFAGPVVVELPKNRPQEIHKDRPEFRIFVAVARCDSKDWPDYRSDCILYELDEEGKVIGTLTLPRFVEGPNYSVQGSTIAWFCQEDGLAKLTPSPERGTRDLIIDLDWRVHRTKERENVWFQDWGYAGSVAFSGESMFRLREGGYVETPDSKTIRLPICVVNLTSQNEKELLLRVPFEGRISIPINNYSHTISPAGDQWKVGSFPLSIEGIEIAGGRLVLTIKSKSDSDSEASERSIDFDLASVLREK